MLNLAPLLEANMAVSDAWRRGINFVTESPDVAYSVLGCFIAVLLFFVWLAWLLRGLWEEKGRITLQSQYAEMKVQLASRDNSIKNLIDEIRVQAEKNAVREERLNLAKERYGDVSAKLTDAQEQIAKLTEQVKRKAIPAEIEGATATASQAVANLVMANNALGQIISPPLSVNPNRFYSPTVERSEEKK
jgi:hypothetical protein